MPIATPSFPNSIDVNRSHRQTNIRLRGYPSADSTILRRPGREQGMALETLGHAVEYLLDSRMFLIESPYTKSEEEAVQILMGCSRRIFEDCPKIPSLRARASNWLFGSFRTQA